MIIIILLFRDVNTFVPAGKRSRKSYDVPNYYEGVQYPYTKLQELCENHRARVICVGDVHGCVEEVCDLLRAVEYHPGDLVVFLGDLVAKGPYSAAVVRLAIDLGALSVRGIPLMCTYTIVKLFSSSFSFLEKVIMIMRLYEKE